MMTYIFVFVFCVFLITMFLYFEQELYLNPYSSTSGYKKLKVKPTILGNGDVIYVIMHQLPISRRWIPVIQCIGIDYGVPVTFNNLDDAKEYIKEHYKGIYGDNKSNHFINGLYV